MSETTHVINPLTGRQLKIGGAMYKKLLRDGVLVNQEPAVEATVTKKKRAGGGSNGDEEEGKEVEEGKVR
jgi:hypothetical protein